MRFACFALIGMTLAACSGNDESAARSSQSLGTCTRAQPSVVIDPAVSAPVPNGTPVSYTLSVTSKDNGDCSPAIIIYNSTNTVGLNIAFQTNPPPQFPLRYALLGPGETAKAQFTAASVPDTGAGDHVFQMAAVNVSALPSNATLLDVFNNIVEASATYRQAGAAQCVHRSPSVSITPNVSAPVALGTTVPYTLTLVNEDDSTCAPQNFLYGNPGTALAGFVPMPNGLTIDAGPSIISGVGSSPSVAPGETFSFVLKVTSSAGLPQGVTNFHVYVQPGVAGTIPVVDTILGYDLL